MYYSGLLASLDKEGRLRHLPQEREGLVTDLSSNDYLGLSLRAGEFLDEFRERFSGAAMSASASRLLAQRQRYHAAYEEYLESLYRRPALLFNSGYHANTGIISALATPGTLIVADKLVHASAIDGLRIGAADFRRFRHNDVASLRLTLEKALADSAKAPKRILVVVESVYSMDGDTAPLREITALKKDFPEMMLYVDEAHAFGVCGLRGLGLCEELGLLEDVDILMATLGKAAASSGAFAICIRDMREWLVNSARSLIFSTALPPVNVAWSHLMTEKITGMERERSRLRELGRWFASRLAHVSGTTSDGEPLPAGPGHIQPLLTGNAERAVALSGRLREAGFDALAIRRPTVPPGGERIRFSLNASLKEESLMPMFHILESGF